MKISNTFNPYRFTTHPKPSKHCPKAPEVSKNYASAMELRLIKNYEVKLILDHVVPLYKKTLTVSCVKPNLSQGDLVALIGAVKECVLCEVTHLLYDGATRKQTKVVLKVLNIFQVGEY